MITADFSFSAAAKQQLARLQSDLFASLPDDPPSVAMIGWGVFYDNRGTAAGEGVVVSYYKDSEVPGIRDSIQLVDGLPLVFFTTAEHAWRFEGKIIDFEEARWFFLADR